jgi:dUTP pyrophosphatase
MNGDNMEKVQVQIVNKSRNPLPEYATPFAAGIDLMADVSNNDKIIIYPGQRVFVPTGIYIAIPDGYEVQVRPRSGLAAKKGISVLNTPGTIDSDYRGEVKVILMNFGEEAVAFGNGDRIAQAILAPVVQIEWNKVEELPTTERGEGGFGSTEINSKT